MFPPPLIFFSPVSHLNACKSYESSQALSQKVTKTYECLNQSASRCLTSIGLAETAVVYTEAFKLIPNTP